MYLPRNNPTEWIAERHRIKIPTLGCVHLKEKGYIHILENKSRHDSWFISQTVFDELINRRL